MYATVRRYVGNAEFADELSAREDEVVDLIRGVSGLRGYYLFRAGNDTISITITDDEAGAEQSSELAAGWIRENLPDAAAASPEISAGEVLVTTE
jgi:hypothetical protein